MAAMSTTQIEMITQAIVKTVNPRKIIMFGSQAKGQAKKDSDVDILVIADRPEGEVWKRREELGNIRRNIPRIEIAVDLLLYSPEEVNKWKSTTNHVISEAFREGEVLYERP
jgi:predicted nucleotidyltransferase